MTQHSPAEICADQLKILADQTRLAVVRQLMQGPANVSELNAQLGVEQSLLSHHLKVLRDAGLLNSQRAGKFVVYTLNPLVNADGSHLDLGCCRLSF